MTNKDKPMKVEIDKDLLRSIRAVCIYHDRYVNHKAFMSLFTWDNRSFQITKFKEMEVCKN